MQHNVTTHPRGWRGRALGALGVFVIAGSALITGPAAAQQPQQTMACYHPPEGGSNTCLTITVVEDPGFSPGADCELHVGIDVQMSRQAAQALIAAKGGHPFGVVLMAHDHDNPDDDTSGLVELTELTPPVAGEQGLSAEFHEFISKQRIDEDRGDESDEVYVRVELSDPSVPGPRRFRSGIITGDGRRCFFTGAPDPNPDPDPPRCRFGPCQVQ
jgi:hypothetical protein